MSFTTLGKHSSSTSPTSTWDIIVIGSGSNGLVTAAYLAAAGKRVLVLERQSWPGGGVASLEMADAGYKSERHSAIHQMILANPLISRDELGLQAKWGLEYLRPDALYAIVFEDGVLPIYQDRARTKKEIARLSAADAEAYDRFMDVAVGVVDAIMPGMFEPPQANVDMSAAFASAGPDVAAAMAAASTESSLDIITRYFKHETVQVALLRFVTEIQLAHPRNPDSGLMTYLGLGLAERFGLALPRGGGTGFTEAVIRCIRAHGGDVWLNTEAIKVDVENGRAVGVRTRSGIIRARDGVVGQIHPHLLGRFVDGLDPSIVADAKQTKLSDYTLFAIHAALDQPLRYTAGPIADEAIMNTVCPGSMKELMDAYDGIEAGRLPDEGAVIVGAGCTTALDPTRAPAGKSTLHVVAMVKHNLASAESHGGAEQAWDAVKDDFAHRVFRHLARFAPNLTPDNILSYHVVAPTDHVRDSPSFQRGDICGLAMSPAQMGAARPTPALARYRVPGVERLYLAGPFMHPGGGVWGGGRPTAKVIFEDLGLDFKALFEKGDAGSKL
ncbi:uncharacterized protein LTHEOB_8570 [Lasiodiplodia theobromae]|uniref:uncharacterized protein n=1 Tax=Lasiodiplodia theobromae TaxID=45133 RepID=UPI0015C2FF31|nr:uncharacterized protein LTHEOB_8570 [Lasiodiplodia theobromae]KAF4541575.1 hypothetical protein LTHEOB_8570 [Lasiodiplodia theobromae]